MTQRNSIQFLRFCAVEKPWGLICYTVYDEDHVAHLKEQLRAEEKEYRSLLKSNPQLQTDNYTISDKEDALLESFFYGNSTGRKIFHHTDTTQ